MADLNLSDIDEVILELVELPSGNTRTIFITQDKIDLAWSKGIDLIGELNAN